jgi:hypothetical protein
MVLEHVLIDLGFAPPSNAYLAEESLRKPETYFPLRVFVCNNCGLFQTEDYMRADELFSSDYAYFSSTSRNWLEHAARYCAMIKKRLKLDRSRFVVEIGSNDGYLLKNFLAAGIPCLGIEPTSGTADVAERQGIPVMRKFFGMGIGEKLAQEGRQADLIIGNNIYAHVPDINDFTWGLKAALKPRGTITLECPHVMRLIEQTQFDTIYHEHYSYLSLYTVERIFKTAGLRVFDVEELPTHGGSLRLYGCHDEDPRSKKEAVSKVLALEERQGLYRPATFETFQQRADQIKNNLLVFLIEQKRLGKKIAAYGAAAKGNTLLNYAGIKPDLIAYVCDAAPSKQGKFLPGSHIPIIMPEVLRKRKPDIVLILAWNIADEIISQHEYIRDWGAAFAVAMPTLTIY